MIVFFDTETTGIPSYKAALNAASQPHIVQLAALAHDHDRKTVASFNFIIKPDGWVIPEAASAIHGITQERALKYGMNIRPCLMLFSRLLESAELVVAHNVDFDVMMLKIQCARNGVPFAPAKTFCTMKTATPIVNLPPTEKMLAAGFNKPKSPKLAECVKFFFNEELEGAHNAQADLDACARVYYHLDEMKK